MRDAQRWFADAVMTPESAPDATGIERAATWLTPGPKLAPGERLEIYRTAYHARLVECLVDDYPALQAALGSDAFEALARAYIARHPSTGPNLNSFGRHMAAFCATGAASPQGACASDLAKSHFASDLAKLEWAIVEVIHAPSTEPLSLAKLGDVPPDRWPGARLEPTPALRILRTAYPVNAFYQAYRDGQDPAIPEAEASSVVVYRSGPTVWRMGLTDPMCDLLTRLTSGATLAEALEATAAALADVSEEVAGQRLMSWFREWVSSGLFTRVVV